MTLPSFGEGENVYRFHDTESAQPTVDSAAARYGRIIGLRQKFGRQILGEGAQVARGLREKDVDPDLQISEVKIVTRKRIFGGVNVSNEVRGTYAGWRLTQAEKAWGKHVSRRGEEFTQTSLDVVPAGIAFNGIALLADGRFMPYETQSSGTRIFTHAQLDERGWASMVMEVVEHARPSLRTSEHERFSGEEPWDVQYGHIEQSPELDLAFAIVQQSQIDEGGQGQYDDRWPMHGYMREEDARYAYHWRPTEPGPETTEPGRSVAGVYGYGIRSGLMSLAQTHGVSISS